MATLREYFAELEAREARLREAEQRGWNDVISGEKHTTRVFECMIREKLFKHRDALIEAAGDVDLGDSWLGFHYSDGDRPSVKE